MGIEEGTRAGVLLEAAGRLLLVTFEMQQRVLLFVHTPTGGMFFFPSLEGLK